MFYIWWPAYIVPGLMVLAGFAGQLLPGRNQFCKKIARKTEGKCSIFQRIKCYTKNL